MGLLFYVAFGLISSIVTGDVLHIEPLCKEHFGEDGKVVNSLVQKYFISQNRQYRVPFGELFGSIPPMYEFL